MKSRSWGWIALVCIALIAGLLVGRSGSTKVANQAAAAPTTSRARTRIIPTVGVGHPEYKDLPVILQLTASIASLHEAVVLPQSSGYLQAVTVRVGDPVAAGQVVAVVNHDQLQSQVVQAQASLAAATTAVETSRASVASAQAQLANAVAGERSADANLVNANAGLTKAQATLADAQATYARTATLVQQGAAAQQALDDAKATVVSDQASVDQARAQISVAEAQVVQSRAQVNAQQQQIVAAQSQVHTQSAMAGSAAAALQNQQIGLQNATIVAPFTGIVIARTLDPGAYVTPGTSTPIVTIADLSELYVLVDVSETQLPMVHRGDPVQIFVDAYPGRIFTGRVSRMSGGVDPQTRTVQVEVDIPNPGHALRPGMYATARINAGNQRTLVVPLTAIVTIGSEHYVWAVVDGKTTQRQVTVGRETGAYVAITGGVTEADTVVFRGSDLVREGQAVQTQQVSL